MICIYIYVYLFVLVLNSITMASIFSECIGSRKPLPFAFLEAAFSRWNHIIRADYHVKPSDEGPVMVKITRQLSLNAEQQKDDVKSWSIAEFLEVVRASTWTRVKDEHIILMLNNIAHDTKTSPFDLLFRDFSSNMLISNFWGSLRELPLGHVLARVCVLLEFNHHLQVGLPFVQHARGGCSRWSLGRQLRGSNDDVDADTSELCGVRGLILHSLKAELLERLLKDTTTHSRPPDSDVMDEPEALLRLTGDRMKANAVKANSDLSPESKHNDLLFGQLASTFSRKNANDFRRRYVKPALWPPFDTQIRTFKISFKGEAGLDLGGPYRAIFNDWMNEVFSEHLRLFIPSPNNAEKAMVGNDLWLPLPGNQSYADYRLFGRLLGMALRGEIPLDLRLPGMVWKHLIEAPRNCTEDLNQIDTRAAQFLQRVPAENKEIGEIDSKLRSLFSDFQIDNFTTILSDGSRAELVPHGRKLPITSANRAQWAELCLKKRLNESSEQLDAIRAGLSDIVPLDLFSLYTPKEIEVLFCGSPDVDVKALRDNAQYDAPMTADTPAVQYFWQTLQEMSGEEKTQFVTFCRGSSRLRPSDKLVISASNKKAMDGFPIARTCFFQLQLPEYSSLEVFKQRFFLAIFGCSGMDLE